MATQPIVASLSFRISTTNMQKASALRLKLHAILDEDEDVHVIASNAARETQTFNVVAVDTEAQEKVEHEVEAASAEDAQAEVESATVIVTAVEPGAA